MAIQEVFYKETKQDITGSSGDDLILVNNASALSATDTIDGGDGTDTLRIGALVSGKYLLPKGLSHVEFVEVSESSDELSSTDPESSSYIGTSAINVDGSQLTGPITLKGNDGANVLLGGSAADTILGYAGNDVIDGGNGADNLSGGAGDDIFVFSNSVLEDTVDGGDGKDTLLYSGTGVFILDDNAKTKLTNVETIALGELKNSVVSVKSTVAAGINASAITSDLILNGNAGANVITGGAGNDKITGGGGKDTLSGGDGDDVFIFNQGNDLVSGTSITGGAGNDTLKLLGAGTYKLAGVTLNGIESVVIGGASTAGVDFTGYSGALTVVGNRAANTFVGREDVSDVFIGGGGADKLDGGKRTADTVGGFGDTFVFKHAIEATTTNIDGGADFIKKGGNALTNGDDAGFDTIIFNETLNSSSPTYNTLVLDSGKVKNVEKVVIWSDAVTGNGDYSNIATNGLASGTLNLNIDASKFTTNITLIGNDGINRIAGGKGADTLTGGAGSDTFVFASGGTGDLSKATDTATLTPDTITAWDFAPSNNDIIDYTTALAFETAITVPTAAVAAGAAVKIGETKVGTDVTAIIAPAVPGGATISSVGLASFAGAITTVYDQVLAVAASLDAKETPATPKIISTLKSPMIPAKAAVNVGADGPKAGEIAYWVNGTDTYVFISDGKAGTSAQAGKAWTPVSAAVGTISASGTVGDDNYVPAVPAKPAVTKGIPGKAGVAAKPLTSGDVLIKIAGDQTAGGKVPTIDSNGNLLFTTDTGAGGGTAGTTVVLTTASDTPTLTLGNDTVDGSSLDTLQGVRVVTGTITTLTSSASVTGTNFVTDGLTAGDSLYSAAGVFLGTVLSVDSATALTLTANATAALTGVSYGAGIDRVVDNYTTDNDTLNALVSGNLTPRITNIENINLTDKFGGHTIDATNITKAKLITLDSTSGNSVTITAVNGTTITSVKAGNNLTDFTVTGISNNPTIIQNKATTITLGAKTDTAGSTDTATINLSGTALSLVSVPTYDLKGLTLVSTATPSVVTLGAGVLATASTLAIKGTGDVTLKAEAVDLAVGKIATISDTLSGSAKFHVDLTKVGTTVDLSGITTADDFVISSSATLGATSLTFKSGVTNLTLNSNVGDGVGGFTAGGGADVLNLDVKVANTNVVTDGYETVNLTNSTGAALNTVVSNFGATGAVKITSNQNVTLGDASFKSIDAKGITGIFTVTGHSVLANATTINSNSNAAIIDMSQTLSASTITTGDKDDTISIGGHATVGDIVLAGGGNDTVAVSAAGKWTSADNLQGGAGTDTLVLTGTTGGATDLTAFSSRFLGFEKISVSDAIGTTALSVKLADASVTGAFAFEAKSANTVGISFDAHLDTNALFTVNTKSSASLATNVIKTGFLNDSITFDGSKSGTTIITGGTAAITGGKGADAINLINTVAGSQIALVKGDSGTVTSPSNGMSVAAMDVISGLQDGDILDLSTIVGATLYNVATEATNNVFTAMPAALANNTVYQVKGTYSPATGAFTAGGGLTNLDSLFIYDADPTASTAFEAVVAVGYAKDSTKGWAKGVWTLGSTGVLLTTGNDTLAVGGPTLFLTGDNNIIDGSVLDTLNAGDAIVDPSITDEDVLNALISGDLTPQIDSVETINITDRDGGHTLTTTTILHAKTLQVDSVNGTSATIAGVKGANIATFKAGDNITALTLNNVEGTGATTPVIVQNKATTITLSDKTADIDMATINLSGTPLILAKGTNALLGINLVSNTASTVTLGTGLIANAAGTIAVSGTGDVTLKAAAADLAVANIATITNTGLTNGAKLHVDLTTVGAAADLSGITADDFTISSTAALTGDLTFKAGITNLTLAKNVIDTGGFKAAGGANTGTDVLNLTETVANAKLLTTDFETVNLINSTNNPLSIATTTATGAALTVTSTRDVTLAAATFKSLDATGVTGSAKISVTAAAGTGATSVIGNQNNTVVDMHLNTGTNTITTFAGNDILTGSSGNDVINSGAGNDIIDITTVNALATPSSGDDRVNAGEGNDTVSVLINQWNTNDVLQGGLGNDTLTLTGTAGTAAVVGTPGAITTTGASFSGFEAITLSGAQTAAASIILADGSVTGSLAFTANQINTAAITFDGSQDTDTAFNINVRGTATTNVIKAGALNDTITFDGNSAASGAAVKAGTVSITAGKGGDSITLLNTLVAGPSTLILDKGDTTALTVTKLALGGTLNLSALTTDVITGLHAGDHVGLSAISTSLLTTQGIVAPSATIPVAFADNQIYQIIGSYASGVFTEAPAGLDSIVVYDADATSGTSFEAIVLTGFAPAGAATLAAGVLTLVV
ncbi:MAG: calcium-binding protein [Methylococcales bacterium]|nr:hypothetical protein [Methylococcaceae bacterium]